MLPIMHQLSKTHLKTLERMTFERLVAASKGEHAATLSYPTFLEFRGERQGETLEAAVDRLSRKSLHRPPYG